MHERRVFTTLSVSGAHEELVGKVVELSQADSKHLATVLRIAPGDPITVVDTVSRKEFQSFVVSVAKTVAVKLDHLRSTKEYRSIVSTLAVGMCKLPATEVIIEKATELGVRKIALMLTDHSVVRLKDQKDFDSKKARFDKIALSAAQQSSRNSLPIIQIYDNLSLFLAQKPHGAEFVGALDESAKSVGELLVSPQLFNAEMTVFIGPEGDFSAAELALLKERKALFFSLGGNRLRSETAAVAAIAAFDAVTRTAKN